MKNKTEVVKINRVKQFVNDIAVNPLDFKYAFTVTGGGWQHAQNIYFISDSQVFYKENFSYDEINNHLNTIKFTRIVDLDTTNMDFETHGNNVGCDAPDITMYRIKNGVDKKIWRVGDYNNSEAVLQIRKAVCCAIKNSEDIFVKASSGGGMSYSSKLNMLKQKEKIMPTVDDFFKMKKQKEMENVKNQRKDTDG